MTTLIIATYFFIKTSNFKSIEVTKRIKLSDRIKKYLKRAGVSPEKFVIVNALIVLTIVFPVISLVLSKQQFDINDFLFTYLLAAPFYLMLAIKNNNYKNMIKQELEKTMRISHFLEITGTKERDVYRHLSHTITGPMNKYLTEITSSYKLRVNQAEIYNQLKSDLSDIHEAVAYANICLQKINTGVSDRILKNQLKAIKELKQDQYKVKRHKNRLKLILMSFVLLLSFLSVVVYPLIKDTLNNLSNILY
jgi:hypothetical protein